LSSSIKHFWRHWDHSQVSFQLLSHVWPKLLSSEYLCFWLLAILYSDTVRSTLRFIPIFIIPFFKTISLFSRSFFGKFSPYSCFIVRLVGNHYGYLIKASIGRLEVLGITETGLKAMEQ
jgi:hypothetical protein